MTPRETGAAAIWAGEHDMPCEWSTVPQPDQEMYLRMFDAAVSAFTLLAAEQGWRMVPEQATEGMALEGARDIGKTMRFENHIERAKSCHRAMLAKAPKFEVGE